MAGNVFVGDPTGNTSPIIDLTNMKLTFLDVLNLENGTWQINFKSNNQNFTTFKVEEPYVETGYLTFSSESPFDLTVSSQHAQYDGLVEYSTDTLIWTEVVKGTAISSADNKIYLRGSGNTYFRGMSSYGNPNASLTLTGSNIKCEGNIETLLDYQTVLNGEHPVMANYCFNNMFYNCTSLTQAPALPATTLTTSCYSYMFCGCTSLTTAPALPATMLANDCYRSMFGKCTSLTQAPTLPATTLAENCYNNMFENCTSLTQAPTLPATTLALSCYSYMFCDCTSLTTLPTLPATTLAMNCYSNMFKGCTSIKLSTTKTGEYVNEYRIPYGTATGTVEIYSMNTMFSSTGGTFTGTPDINTVYYTSNEIIQ